jgi:hypothetical protein
MCEFEIGEKFTKSKSLAPFAIKLEDVWTVEFLSAIKAAH